MNSLQRLFAVLIVVALLGVGVVIDRAVSKPALPFSSTEVVPDKAPTAAPEQVSSSSWYCPGGSLTADGNNADGSVTLANGGNANIGAEVTVLSADKTKPPPKRVDVPAKGSVTVRYADVLGKAQPAGASIVVEGGGVVASQSLKTPEGTVSSACASQGGRHWYSGTGSTAADTSMHLSLFNPFPEDAIVDVGFLTDQGGARPSDSQGIVVPARSLKMVDVADKVRRREWVATTVTTKVGRIVVGRTWRRATMTQFSVAAPELASTWAVPSLVRTEGGKERLIVYNPGERPTQVTLEFNGTGQNPIQPVKVDVGPNARAEIDVSDQLPKGAGVGVEASTSEEVAVLVERATSTTIRGTAGTLDQLALPLQARRWIAPAGNAKGTDVIGVVNMGQKEVRPRLTLLDGKRQELKIEVPALAPGDRASIKLDAAVVKGGPVLVEGDDDIVVDRTITDGSVLFGGPAVALS